MSSSISAPPAQSPAPPPATLRKAVVSSTLGTCIEWYDFYVYGVAAAIIFNVQFFPPGTSPYVGTLLAFSTYAVGFAARPIGGIVFAHFGDRVGRKQMLMITLALMGGGTFLIGCLPNYDQIGIWAPVLLVVLRVVQGIGVGGEWGGAALMATEHAPPHRRGFFGSWPQIGVPAGTLGANGAFIIMGSMLSDEQFTAWGWRIPFLLSITLIVISFYIRSRVDESPAFAEIKARGEIEKMPVWTVVRTQPTMILRVAGMRFAENANYYIFTTFLLVYGPQVGMSQNSILIATITMAALGLVSIPFWGAVSDRVGRRPLIIAGAVVMALIAFPFFTGVGTTSTPVMVLLMIVAVNIGRDLCYAPQPAYFTELFEPKVRYSGASVGPQLAAVFAGGFAPLIAMALVGENFDRTWLVSLYMIFMCLVTVVSAALTPETRVKAPRPA